MVGVVAVMVTSFKRTCARTAVVNAPDPVEGHSLLAHASAADAWMLTGNSGSVSCGVIAPFSWVLVHIKFCLCPPRVCFPSPVEVL